MPALNVNGENVGIIPCGFEEPQKSLYHDIIAGAGQLLRILATFTKTWADKFGSNSMMEDPSAHPLHMNDVTYIVYV